VRVVFFRTATTRTRLNRTLYDATTNDDGGRMTLRADGPWRVGVGVLLRRNTEVLVGFNHKMQAWSLPGGAVERSEHPIQAAVRELHEETDITIAPEWLSLRAVTTHECDSDRVNSACTRSLWCTLFYEAHWDRSMDWVQGTPRPEEIDQWRWVVCHPDYLPRPLVPALAAYFEPDNKFRGLKL
jgi:8-oxo-dGTP pyrophosphatase MutT (NUDIX family)